MSFLVALSAGNSAIFFLKKKALFRCWLHLGRTFIDVVVSNLRRRQKRCLTGIGAVVSI